MKKEQISIIVPCFNEEASVPLFLEEMGKTAGRMQEEYNIEFEYIFVDDGSTDKTASVIKNIRTKFFFCLSAIT